MPNIECMVERWMRVAGPWDLPEFNQMFLAVIQYRRYRRALSSGIVMRKGSKP